MNLKIIDKSAIQAGNVLLCYSPDMTNKVEGLEYGYSHVAICLNSSDVVESTSGGVKQTTIDNILEEYSHIAVLSSKEYWNKERVQMLRDFSESKIGAQFNLNGIKEYKDRKEKNRETIMEQLQGYFDGSTPPVSPHNDVYFCSEFVTSVFIHVGIIDATATVIFRPNTYSPEDIGKDKAFGFFIGYIIPDSSYKIPEDDIFRTGV